MAVMFEHMRSLGPETTSCDTRGDARLRRCAAAGRRARLGAVGYCMSGPFVVWAGGRASRAAPLHRVDLRRQHGQRPARRRRTAWSRRLRCESYFACAEIDKWATPADIAALEAALQAAGAPHRIEWYPGRRARLRVSAARTATTSRRPSGTGSRLFDLFARTPALTAGAAARRRQGPSTPADAMPVDANTGHRPPTRRAASRPARRPRSRASSKIE